MTKEELMNAICRVRTLLATGRYLLTIDYRKKDINNEK